MATKTEKFGFIRTTLANWAPWLFPNRAGIVTDAPKGATTSETWGWYTGSQWNYCAKRAGDEVFSGLAVTGDVTSTGSFHANSAPGVPARVRFQSNGVNRWSIYKDASGESGDNAGSAIAITAWSDAGAVIDNPVVIKRASGGEIQLNRPIAGSSLVKQYTSEYVVGKLYSKTATTSVAATTNEVSLITGEVSGASSWAGISVPAGRLNISGLLSDLKLKGIITTPANTLVTWRIRVNGVVVATQAVTRSWGSSYWRIEGNGTTRTTGASGVRQWDIGLYATADNASATISYYDLGWNQTGLDLTAVSRVDVTVQAGNTTSTITCNTAYMRVS